MASGHGGKRSNSGRKPRAERFARPIAAAEKKIADHLPEILDQQFSLALGGAERIEEEWVTAGTVTFETIETGDDGRAIRSKHLAFPEMPPTVLVLVKRKVLTLPGDPRANEYLIDRILDKPKQMVEADVTSNGETINTGLEGALLKIYGTSDRKPENSEPGD